MGSCFSKRSTLPSRDQSAALPCISATSLSSAAPSVAFSKRAYEPPAVRVEEDAGPVRRPERVDLVRRVGREPGERAAREVEDPDVDVPVHHAVHRDAAAVGREARARGSARVGLAHGARAVAPIGRTTGTAVAAALLPSDRRRARKPRRDGGCGPERDQTRRDLDRPRRTARRRSRRLPDPGPAQTAFRPGGRAGSPAARRRRCIRIEQAPARSPSRAAER